MFTGKAPTDAMFVDGLTLQGYVEMAFPDRLMDIVDPVLHSTDATCATNQQYRSNGWGEIDNAIISVTELALSCCFKLTVAPSYFLFRLVEWHVRHARVLPPFSLGLPSLTLTPLILSTICAFPGASSKTLTRCSG